MHKIYDSGFLILYVCKILAKSLLIVSSPLLSKILSTILQGRFQKFLVGGMATMARMDTNLYGLHMVGGWFSTPRHSDTV